MEGLEGATKKATEPGPKSGKGGARDGNIFETEQAPGLLIELDVGDKAKAMIKYQPLIIWGKGFPPNFWK